MNGLAAFTEALNRFFITRARHEQSHPDPL